MSIIETARVTSKGQITIPNRIRKILHANKGTSMVFVLCRQGVFLSPCKITAKLPYAPKEWAKIEKLSFSKGKIFKSSREAKKYIETL